MAGKKGLVLSLDLESLEDAKPLEDDKSSRVTGGTNVPDRKAILAKREAQAKAEKGFFCRLSNDLHRRVRDYKFQLQDQGQRVTLSELAQQAFEEFLAKRNA